MSGEISNALNFPSITAEEAPRLTPWVKLAEYLGLFAGQLTEDPIKGIRVEFEGSVGALNVRPMTAAALFGVLKPQMQEMVKRLLKLPGLPGKDAADALGLAIVHAQVSRTTLAMSGELQARAHAAYKGGRSY